MCVGTFREEDSMPQVMVVVGRTEKQGDFFGPQQKNASKDMAGTRQDISTKQSTHHAA